MAKPMTREEAIAFAEGEVPSYPLLEEEAEEWCRFLNYLTDSNMYHVVEEPEDSVYCDLFNIEKNEGP